MRQRNCEGLAGADFLGEDVVDGKVVADEEEVAELDVLLPQQALPPRDLPHLGQDLKPALKYLTMIAIIRVKGKFFFFSFSWSSR